MELWFCSVCIRIDIKLAAGLSFSLPPWIPSFCVRVCEDRDEAKGSTNCTILVSCNSWNCSSLSLFWDWSCKDGFVSSCSWFSQMDEWGRSKTSASLNSGTCSSSCCWLGQSSWSSSLMCRGSGSLWTMLRFSSCSKWCCSGGVSSLQTDNWQWSRKTSKTPQTYASFISLFL